MPGPPPPRRRRGPRLRVVPVGLLLLGVGAAAWAASTPGGIPARVDEGVTRVREQIEGQTADPNLRRATDHLEAAFDRDGRYPTAESLAGDASGATDWTVGVTYLRCSDRMVVVQGLSGRGTVSRLLVDGERRGDVAGDAECPQDPSDPAPW